jgi:hypothetical protein
LLDILEDLTEPIQEMPRGGTFSYPIIDYRSFGDRERGLSHPAPRRARNAPNRILLPNDPVCGEVVNICNAPSQEELYRAMRDSDRPTQTRVVMEGNPSVELTLDELNSFSERLNLNESEYADLRTNFLADQVGDVSRDLRGIEDIS